MIQGAVKKTQNNFLLQNDSWISINKDNAILHMDGFERKST